MCRLHASQPEGRRRERSEKFGLAPDMEARFARNAADIEGGGFSYQKLAPNFEAPFGHKHQTQEEAYVIVSGSGRVKLGDEVRELKQWDVVRVQPSRRARVRGRPGRARADRDRLRPGRRGGLDREALGRLGVDSGGEQAAADLPTRRRTRRARRGRALRRRGHVRRNAARRAVRLLARLERPQLRSTRPASPSSASGGSCSRRSSSSSGGRARS